MAPLRDVTPVAGPRGRWLSNQTVEPMPLLHPPETPAPLATTQVAPRSGRPKKRDPFYFWIAVAMTCTAFAGFSFTYFGPMLRGAYPEVSPLVHVHGWTYFGWYLLVPLQAGLIRAGRFPIHRALGSASLVLGALMVGVGLVVSSVRVEMARAPEPDPFWELMGVPIFAIWALFTAFYVAAMLRVRRPAEHKRLVLLASAVALSAATFRIVARMFGFGTGVAVVGCLAPVLFVVAAMLHDRRRLHAVHPIYRWGAVAMVGVIGGAFLLPAIPAGRSVETAIAWIGRLLMPLY